MIPKDLEIWAGLKLLGVHQSIYQRTGGRWGSRVGRYQLLMLHTKGRKTGAPRVAALLYRKDAMNFIVVASKGGSDSAPAWFHNLMADPEVEVQVGTKKSSVTARVATDDERPRLWKLMTSVWPDYDRYQARTERRIPVVILEPR